MKKVNFEEIKKIVDNNKDKIICVVISANDCPYCDSFKLQSIDKVKDKFNYVDWYEVKYKEIEALSYFPPHISPMCYFFVPNCELVPLIRPGAATPDALENELNNFTRLMNGEKLSEVYK